MYTPELAPLQYTQIQHPKPITTQMGRRLVHTTLRRWREFKRRISDKRGGVGVYMGWGGVEVFSGLQNLIFMVDVEEYKRGGDLYVVLQV